MLWFADAKLSVKGIPRLGIGPSLRDETVRSNNEMMRDSNKTVGCSNACSSIGRRILAHMFECVLKLR